MRRLSPIARRSSCLVLAASICALSGCEFSADGDAAPPDKKITLTVVDRAGYDKAVAAHKGNVVLIDFWATWCEPCKEQFPHTVELSQKYSAADFVAMSVSLDYPEDREQVLEFLREQGADFENLITEYKSSEQDTQFELKGAGVPHYKLYDRSGKLRYIFNDQLEDPMAEKTDKGNIEIRIKELLAEGAGSSETSDPSSQ